MFNFTIKCCKFVLAIILLVPTLSQGAVPAAPGGLCINKQNCARSHHPADAAVAPASVDINNFYPGHYMSVGYAHRSSFDKIKNNPYFVGVKRNYHWSHIETAEGVYDFSEIEADLAYAQSMGKRLWIVISRTSWNSNSPPDTPRYMWGDAKYGCDPRYYGNYERSAQAGGWLPCFWNSHYQTRQAALYQALGERFNDEPYFSGINMGETSTGKTHWGYSAQALEAAFKKIALDAKAAFPNKVVTQMINYAPYDLAPFSAWLAENGIGIGGPDVHLQASKKDSLHAYAYPQYLKYHDIVPTGPDVQGDNYRRNAHLVTSDYENVAEVILLGAIEKTNPWYMFWRPVEPYFSEQVLPMVDKHGQLPAAKAFYESIQGGPQ